MKFGFRSNNAEVKLIKLTRCFQLRGAFSAASANIFLRLTKVNLMLFADIKQAETYYTQISDQWHERHTFTFIGHKCQVRLLRRSRKNVLDNSEPVFKVVEAGRVCDVVHQHNSLHSETARLTTMKSMKNLPHKHLNRRKPLVYWSIWNLKELRHPAPDSIWVTVDAANASLPKAPTQIVRSVHRSII